MTSRRKQSVVAALEPRQRSAMSRYGEMTAEPSVPHRPQTTGEGPGGKGKPESRATELIHLGDRRHPVGRRDGVVIKSRSERFKTLSDLRQSLVVRIESVCWCKNPRQPWRAMAIANARLPSRCPSPTKTEGRSTPDMAAESAGRRSSGFARNHVSVSTKAITSFVSEDRLKPNGSGWSINPIEMRESESRMPASESRCFS